MKLLLVLVAPFVKDTVMREVLAGLDANVRVCLLSCLNIGHLQRGSSDLRALTRLLHHGGEIYNHQGLHSKVYVFDATAAVVTSGNLTHSGLKSNFEYGVVLREPGAVARIAMDLAALRANEETRRLTAEMLADVDAILRAATPPEPHHPERLSELGDELHRVFQGHPDAISSALGGWMREVFEVLCSVDGAVFSLEEVYKHVPSLERRYPENHHVAAKVRQQLQELRDRGLLRFLGNGTYEKLWT